MKLKFFLIIGLFPILCQGQVVKGFKQLSDKINITLSEGTLSICPLTENAVRVKFYREPEVQMPELVFTSKVPASQFRVSDSPSKIEIKTKKKDRGNWCLIPSRANLASWQNRNLSHQPMSIFLD